MYLVQSRDKKVLKIDQESLQIQFEQMQKNEKNHSKLWFLNEEREQFGPIVEADNAIYIFPLYSNMILKADYCNQTIERYKEFKEDYPYIKFTAAKIIDEKIYAFSFMENAWMIIDSKTEQSVTNRIDVTETVKDKVCDKLLFGNDDEAKLYTEDSFYGGEDRWAYTLPHYIESVVRGTNNLSKDNISLCGKEIYDSIL